MSERGLIDFIRMEDPFSGVNSGSSYTICSCLICVPDFATLFGQVLRKKC